jgi:hypothetical protein
MPAGATYDKIATTTLTSAGSIDLSSIPSTYTDLVVVLRGKSSGSTNNIRLRFNGDTASNYSNLRFLAYSGTADSNAQTNMTSAGIGDWGSIEGAAIINIFSYANTTTWKNYASRSVEPDYTSMYSGQWRSTSAINQITILYPSGSLATGTTATIYGIARA